MSDQPSPRRRFQFSLRTLLIVVAFVAVAAAIVKWIAPPIHNRAVAGKWICKMNGLQFSATFTMDGHVVFRPVGVSGPDPYGGSYTFNPKDQTIELHLLVDKGGPGDMELVEATARLTQDGALIYGNRRFTRNP